MSDPAESSPPNKSQHGVFRAPSSVTSLDMSEYRQTATVLCGYPCVLTISLVFLLHARFDTILPVLKVPTLAPVPVFQNRMHRSIVPPPLASRLDWCGDHAIAFTAAV